MEAIRREVTATFLQILERAAAKEPEAPAKPTAAEVDAKKAKPSGAVAAKGGTTALTDRW